MARIPTRRTKFTAERIDGLVKDLNVVDVDVSDVARRVRGARNIGNPGDASSCIIYCECCIINCRKDRVEEIRILESGAATLDGFAFKINEQRGDAAAPVFYVKSMDSRSFLRMGEGALQIPGGNMEGRTLGLAGEFFGAGALKSNNIAPTAPVVALSPAGR